jgi:hypothetical protein
MCLISSESEQNTIFFYFVVISQRRNAEQEVVSSRGKDESYAADFGWLSSKEKKSEDFLLKSLLFRGFLSSCRLLDELWEVALRYNAGLPKTRPAKLFMRLS